MGMLDPEIAAAVEGLLAGGDRIVEHHDAVRASLEDYKAGRADFVDGVIARVNRAYDCEASATFDQKAAKLDGFVQVNPTFSTRDANWRFHSKKTQKTRVQSRKETRKADVVKTKWLFNLRSHFRIRRHVLAIRTAD